MRIEVDVMDTSTERMRRGFFELSPGPPYSLLLALPDGEILRASERDYFDCLRSIRTQLELQKLVVLCNGARRDVYPPTGLTRQWGGGKKAYVLKFDTPPAPGDAVDIFAPAEKHLIASVDAQRDYFVKWFEITTGHKPSD
jgi:hypothetical protein